MNAIQIAEIAESWVADKMDNYIQKVAKVYSLPLEDLRNIARGVSVGNKSETVIEEKRLLKLKKKELQDKCKELGCRTTGNKSDLVARIVSATSGSSEKSDQDRKPPEIKANKNAQGNYVYDGLVIDKGTKMVVGRELKDGSIGSLRRVDIDKCHQHKLKFAIPINISEEEKVQENEEEEIEDNVEEEDEEVEEEDEEAEEEDEDDEAAEEDEAVDNGEDDEDDEVCDKEKEACSDEEEDEDIEYVYED
jgi:hypothetical protein